MSNETNRRESDLGGEEGFRHYAIMELFGHQMIAGLVSEQQLGGAAFVRVDVPTTEAREGYTKLFNPSAIYAITPTDEATARQMAESLNQAPISEWRFRSTVELPAGRDDEDDY